MSFTFDKIKDIDLFKQFLINTSNNSICYVYYKDKISYNNVEYIGFTKQEGIKKFNYFIKHHTIKKLLNKIKNRYGIKIFKNCNENDLILIFNPKLNFNMGNGICDKKKYISNYNLKKIGIIFNKIYYKKCKSINDNKHIDLFLDLNKYTIDKHHFNFAENYFNQKYNNLINKFINEEKTKHIFKFNKLFSILIYCKLNNFYNFKKIIIKIYKKYLISYINPEILKEHWIKSKKIRKQINKDKYICHCGKKYKSKVWYKKHIKNNYCSIISFNNKWNILKNEKLKNNKQCIIDETKYIYIICKKIINELKIKKYLIEFTNINHKLWSYYKKNLEELNNIEQQNIKKIN